MVNTSYLGAIIQIFKPFIDSGHPEEAKLSAISFTEDALQSLMQQSLSTFAAGKSLK